MAAGIVGPEGRHPLRCHLPPPCPLHLLYNRRYLGGYATSGFVMVCDDPMGLTGCRKLFGCRGASTPSTVDKGCLSANNTLKSTMRAALYPA